MVARRAEPAAEARVPLSKERVLQAAIAIADREGIDSLTMRRLAQKLGVEAMSLYYYVPNKDAIIAGIVDMVVSEIDLPSGANWKTAIRNSAISYHQALARHPWATNVMRKTFGSPQLRLMDSILRQLREGGFSAEVTYHAYHALDSHILGSTMWEAGFAAVKNDLAKLAEAFLKQIPIEEYPYFSEHARQHMTKAVRGKSTFEFGLDLILDSLEKIRGAEPRRSRRARRRRGSDSRST
jgi:AcrR family transcriptional regulator